MVATLWTLLWVLIYVWPILQISCSCFLKLKCFLCVIKWDRPWYLNLILAQKLTAFFSYSSLFLLTCGTDWTISYCQFGCSCSGFASATHSIVVWCTSNVFRCSMTPGVIGLFSCSSSSHIWGFITAILCRCHQLVPTGFVFAVHLWVTSWRWHLVHFRRLGFRRKCGGP